MTEIDDINHGNLENTLTRQGETGAGRDLPL